MQPLSATDCITPAVARTKLVLFTPFRKGRTWKLCATAYLCRAGTMFFPFTLLYLFLLPITKSAGGARAVIVFIAVVLLVTALFLWLFYLCSRLQFAFFDIVVNRCEFVAPAWRKYGTQSLPWTGIKVLFGVVVTLAFALPIVAYVRRLIPLFHAMQALKPGQAPPMQFIALLYAGYGLILLVFGSLYLVSSLLTDFIVPSLALEDTGLAEAFRRMGELIRLEPGQFALYTLLKVVLGLTIYFAAIMAWEIALLLSTVILGLIAFAVGFVLHLIGVPSAVLTVLAILLGIAWYFFAVFYIVLFAIGPVLTFMDAYAVYFLGGRYPMLGDLLDRSTPPPAYAYAAAFAPYPPPYYPPQPGPPPPQHDPNS
jgi:hypothetical protein